MSPTNSGEDLLFTESGKPARNDLISGLTWGTKTPFMKPYIVQYATNALPPAAPEG